MPVLVVTMRWWLLPLLALPFLVIGVLRASTFDFGSVTMTTDGNSLTVN